MADRPVTTVLVIGPSQNGKSTFINRLIDLSETNNVPLAGEGDGNFKCTYNCTAYDLEVPLTDYKLVQVGNGEDYAVPNSDREDEFLGAGWWRKQTRAKYAVKKCQPNGPRMRIRLIDTPGLDDCDGTDYENMEAVLKFLNEKAQSFEKWEREIHALVFVYNFNSSFTYSFQQTLKDYERCMPNLFGGLTVVNTYFNVTAWAQKRQHLIQEQLLGSTETAKVRIMKERRAEFSKILNRNPTHFFIDNKPKKSLAFDELLSCNTICDILNYWSNSKPMEIGQMRLFKTMNMKAVDKRLQSYLLHAISQWNIEKDDEFRKSTKEEATRSYLEQLNKEHLDDIARIKSDLERYDNDSEYTINTHVTSDDASAPELFFRWAFRLPMSNEYSIQEPDFEEFYVAPQNGVGHRWISHTFDHPTKTWNGKYEADPGKVPRLIARSFTTNRVYHQDKISSLKSQLRPAKVSLVKNEANRKIHAADEVGGQNIKLERLVEWITAAKDLSEVLQAERPPLDKSFDEAARKRYKKSPDKIEPEDLFDTVKGMKPVKLRPLRDMLSDID